MWINNVGQEQEDLFSMDLPYTGCVLSMKMNQYNTVTDFSEGAQTSCKSVFSEKCYNALLSHAKNEARDRAGVAMNSSSCPGILDNLKNVCGAKTEQWGVLSTGGCKLRLMRRILCRYNADMVI